MRTAKTLTIDGRKIGAGAPPYIVAELSANHQGDIEHALSLIVAAKRAGADAVKIQTYTADTITIDHDGPGFKIESGLWRGRTLYELYQEASTPWEWHADLFAKARELDLTIFSSPFDPLAVDFLEALGSPAYKVASFEIVDIPLLKKVASTGKPVILSTGMASLAEIDEAVTTLLEGGTGQIALLKCTSAYPALAGSMNLRTIPCLAQSFGVVAGLSDHSLDVAVPVSAVVLGASIVEKHFTLSRKQPGPDSAFSLEPSEMRNTIEAIRVAEQAMGGVRFGTHESEESSMVFRRSLFVVKEVAAGERLTPENVRDIRPGYGLHTRFLEDVMGRTAVSDIPRGTPLSWDHIGPHSTQAPE